jgi:hypothetical protein
MAASLQKIAQVGEASLGDLLVKERVRTPSSDNTTTRGEVFFLKKLSKVFQAFFD